MDRRWLFIVLSLVTVSVPSFGQNRRSRNSQAPQRLRAEKPASGGLRPTAWFTTRPTWQQNDPAFRVENTAEAGLRLSDDTMLTYVQDFWTNQVASGRLDRAGDFTPTVRDGFVRLTSLNVRKWEEYDLALHSQTRAYLPTEAGKRGAGFIGGVRQYFMFASRMTSNFSFWFYEVPGIHLYDRSSHSVDGKATANPAFDNRVTLEPNLTFGNVAIALPLNFSVTKYRSASGAAKSGEWIPSLTMAANVEWGILGLWGPLSVGFYYETGNLTKETDAGLIWDDGQRAGSYQGYVRVGF